MGGKNEAISRYGTHILVCSVTLWSNGWCVYFLITSIEALLQNIQRHHCRNELQLLNKRLLCIIIIRTKYQKTMICPLGVKMSPHLLFLYFYRIYEFVSCIHRLDISICAAATTLAEILPNLEKCILLQTDKIAHCDEHNSSKISCTTHKNQKGQNIVCMKTVIFSSSSPVSNFFCGLAATTVGIQRIGFEPIFFTFGVLKQLMFLAATIFCPPICRQIHFFTWLKSKRGVKQYNSFYVNYSVLFTQAR